MFADLNTDIPIRGVPPYDIALIKTKQPIHMTMNVVKPIPLINKTDPVPYAKECVVPGWGDTTENGGLYIHNYVCMYIYIYYIYIYICVYPMYYPM